MVKHQTTIGFTKSDLLIKISQHKTRIVITKKVAPKAVDRNRIRRIIKEALKSQNLKGKNLEIFVRKNIAQQKSQDLRKIIQKILY